MYLLEKTNKDKHFEKRYKSKKDAIQELIRLIKEESDLFDAEIPIAEEHILKELRQTGEFSFYNKNDDSFYVLKKVI